MGDHLQAGKQSRSVTSHLGRLSLLPSVGWQNVYQPSCWVIIINGDGGCRWWQPTGGLTAQVGWLGLKVSFQLEVCICRMNRVNSHNDLIIKTSLLTLSSAWIYHGIYWTLFQRPSQPIPWLAQNDQRSQPIAWPILTKLNISTAKIETIVKTVH